MPHASVRSAAAIGMALLSGCSVLGTEPGMCTMEARPGVIVEVRDAATGAPLAVGSVGVAREGAFADTLTAFDAADAEMFGVHERKGTYMITVTRPGYEPWVAESVRVTEGDCHVETRRLEARLVATP